MDINDIIFLIVILGIPVICSLTMGREGTFTDSKKKFATFGVSFIGAICYGLLDKMNLYNV